MSRVDSKKESSERYEDAVRNVQAATQNPVDATPAIESIAPHAPRMAEAFSRHVQRGATWLASQVPQPPKWGSRTPSDLEQHEFLTKVDAVDHPVDAILGGLSRGDLTKTQVDAVKNGATPMYDELVRLVQARVSRSLAADRRIPYPVKRDLSLLFDMPIDWSMTPDGLSQLQKAASAPPPQSDSPGTPKGPARHTVKSEVADRSETPAQRRLGGQIR